MRIVILGSVALPVPPPMQGGTERIAYWQAVELAKREHKVTLIAAKGSKKDPAYTLVEIGGGDTVAGSSFDASRGSFFDSLRQGPTGTYPSSPGAKAVTELEKTHRAASAFSFVESSRNLRKELVYMAEVSQWLLDYGKEFDVILNNMRGGESVLLPLVKLLGKPFVTVMHLPLFPELATLFMTYQTPVITISNAQREGFEGVNFVGTVYNATDLDELPFQQTPQEYLLMMGSIASHKNQKDGILAAKALGKKIILAGKIGSQAYFDREIAPLVDGNMVQHVGEMGTAEKAKLLGNAQALIFPVLWPEPFGLVMIEAMAVGTPVVAYRNGAVPEVVVDGKTGFIVDPASGVDGLVAAVKRIGEIERAQCRRYVEANFTIEKMVNSLEEVLKKI